MGKGEKKTKRGGKYEQTLISSRKRLIVRKKRDSGRGRHIKPFRKGGDSYIREGGSSRDVLGHFREESGKKGKGG